LGEKCKKIYDGLDVFYTTFDFLFEILAMAGASVLAQRLFLTKNPPFSALMSYRMKILFMPNTKKK